MRTTLTLDPDVADRLQAYARARKLTFKEAVNELLRRGLSPGAPARPKPFVVKPHTGGFLPGIDPVRLRELLEEEDDTQFLASARAT